MSEIINQGIPEVTRYYTKCFNCGAGFVYKKTEVHRNVALNRVVAKHGFTGYDGEVHCPSCGTWLPHYEQNRYREPAVQQAQETARYQQAAPAGTAAAENTDGQRFCGQCGSPVAPGNLFCGQCGAKVE